MTTTRVAATIVIVLGLLGLSAYMIFNRPEEAAQNACEGKKIVAFGDSLVAGYGASEGNDFVSALSRTLELPIINMGRNGDTSATAFGRITALTKEQGNVVIILVGGNDALQRMPVEQTEQNLASIIDSAGSSGAKVVLAGIIGGFPSDPYKPMFERLQERFSVEYVPNVLSGIITNSKLMSDQIHPNDEGYAKVAEKILPALKRACE